jgi:hypothetical protein
MGHKDEDSRQVFSEVEKTPLPVDAAGRRCIGKDRAVPVSCSSAIGIRVFARGSASFKRPSLSHINCSDSHGTTLLSSKILYRSILVDKNITQFQETGKKNF